MCPGGCLRNANTSPSRILSLTSPLWPSSTFWQEPPAMSQTTASSSPEVVMACEPVAEIAPSVSQPPWPDQAQVHTSA